MSAPKYRLFSGLADLERALARMNAAGAGVGPARDAPHVILYEDTARRRVQVGGPGYRGTGGLGSPPHAAGRGCRWVGLVPWWAVPCGRERAQVGWGATVGGAMRQAEGVGGVGCRGAVSPLSLAGSST